MPWRYGRVSHKRWILRLHRARRALTLCGHRNESRLQAQYDRQKLVPDHSLGNSFKHVPLWRGRKLTKKAVRIVTIAEGELGCTLSFRQGRCPQVIDVVPESAVGQVVSAGDHLLRIGGFWPQPLIKPAFSSQLDKIEHFPFGVSQCGGGVQLDFMEA
eukprot:6363726-Amphidinium_carterae.2